MNKSSKKGLSIFLDVLLVIIIAAVLFISINSIVSQEKGYTSLFGKVLFPVKTDSMEGQWKDSFNKNSLIIGKELILDTDKKNLEVGQVITFWTMINGQRVLNTHRIVGIDPDGGELNRQYITRGDNTPANDPSTVMWSDVVAVYESKIDGIGAVVLFAQTSVGFFIVAVVPSILLFGYCIVLFSSSLRKVNSKKQEEDEQAKLAAALEAQKEELRKQILAELGQTATVESSEKGDEADGVVAEVVTPVEVSEVEVSEVELVASEVVASEVVKTEVKATPKKTTTIKSTSSAKTGGAKTGAKTGATGGAKTGAKTGGAKTGATGGAKTGATGGAKTGAKSTTTKTTTAKTSTKK